MAILTITLSLLKRQKAYGVTIFCLSLIVALMLSSVLTVLQRGGAIQHEAVLRISMSDVVIFAALSEHDEGLPALLSELRGAEAVENVRVGSILYSLFGDVLIGGQELQEAFVVAAYDPGYMDYRIKSHDAGFALKDGEALLPLKYESIFSIGVGDIVSIDGHDFTVAGFFEDPIFGSPIMTVGRAYINERDYSRLHTDSALQGVSLSIDVHAEHGDPDYARQVLSVYEAFAFIGPWSSTSRVDQSEVNMMVPNMISAFLLAFALLSLLITLLILRYAVLSSIEGSYVTLGVFKAVGYVGMQIRAAVMLQYAFVCLVGAIAGVLLGIPLVPVIGGVVMSMAGLLWSGGLWVLTGVLVIIAVALLVCIVALLCTRKIRRISPVRAISFGRAPVYFAQRLNMPLRRLGALPLHLRMAIKQMMTRRKQYALLVLVAALLTFMASFMGATTRMFNDAGKVMYVFGFPRSDVTIAHVAEDLLDLPAEALETMDRIVEEISEQYPVETAYEMIQAGMHMEGTFANLLAFCDFDIVGLIEPLSGRYPIYDNEVALTPVMAALYEKGIGDTVNLHISGFEPAPFIVTGLAQSINTNTVNITTEGVRRLTPGNPVSFWTFVFEEGTDVEAAVAEIRYKYETDVILVVQMEAMVETMFDSIAEVLDIVAVISFALTVVLIALITFLLTIIAMYREHGDIGIFKACGFTSGQLRLQFALRFLLVSLAGGLVGLVASLLGSDALMTFIMGFFGLSRVGMEIGPVELLLPITLVCVISLAAAWLVSAKVKRVSCRVLVTE